MSYEIEWRPGAIEDITALFEYLVENASIWDARNVTERLITATDRLADYPRLYETDERYGEGVRRISLLGQHVLSILLAWENFRIPSGPLNRSFKTDSRYCFKSIDVLFITDTNLIACLGVNNQVSS